MTHHTHRAVSALSRTVAWTHCVRHDGCSGAAHGGVTFIDTCRCGARRYTESNGNHVRRGPWVEPELNEDHEVEVNGRRYFVTTGLRVRGWDEVAGYYSVTVPVDERTRYAAIRAAALEE